MTPHLRGQWGLPFAPCNTAFPEEEVTSAPDPAVHRRRQTRDAILINNDLPSRPRVGEEAHHERFAAPTWALHHGIPLVRSLTDDVEHAALGIVRDLTNALYAIGWRSERDAAEPAGKPTSELRPPHDEGGTGYTEAVSERGHAARRVSSVCLSCPSRARSLSSGIPRSGRVSPRPAFGARAGQGGPSGSWRSRAWTRLAR